MSQRRIRQSTIPVPHKPPARPIPMPVLIDWYAHGLFMKEIFLYRYAEFLGKLGFNNRFVSVMFYLALRDGM